MIYDLRKAERNYKLKKLDYNTKKANLWVTTNWNDINEKRAEEGLPKLSNQTMKEGYIDLLLEDLSREVTEAEVEYNFLRRKQRVQELELKIQGE